MSGRIALNLVLAALNQHVPFVALALRHYNQLPMLRVNALGKVSRDQASLELRASLFAQAHTCWAILRLSVKGV
jgi:hypothetical protein